MKKLSFFALLATTIYGAEELEEPYAAGYRDFCAFLDTLPAVTTEHRTNALRESIALLPADQQQSVAELVKCFPTEGMHLDRIRSLVTSLSSLPADQHESFLALMKSLFKREAAVNYVADIADLLSRVPVDHRESFLMLERLFCTDDISQHSKLSALDCLVKVKVERFESVSLIVKLFSVNNIADFNIQRLIRSIALLPDDQYDSGVALAQSLLTDNIDAVAKALNLCSLLNVPVNLHESVANVVRFFFEGNMQVSSILEVTSCLTFYPDLAELAESLLTDSMEAVHIADIVYFLSSVPAGQREERAERARNNIDLQPDDEDFFNRLIQILELSSDQPIPPLNPDMAAVCGGYAYGVHVHA